MLTLGTTFAGIGYAMSGEKKPKEQGPPINAGSKDEEQFILYVDLVIEIHNGSRESLMMSLQGLFKASECRRGEGEVIEVEIMSLLGMIALHGAGFVQPLQERLCTTLSNKRRTSAYVQKQ